MKNNTAPYRARFLILGGLAGVVLLAALSMLVLSPQAPNGSSHSAIVPPSLPAKAVSSTDYPETSSAESMDAPLPSMPDSGEQLQDSNETPTILDIPPGENPPAVLADKRPANTKQIADALDAIVDDFTDALQAGREQGLGENEAWRLAAIQADEQYRQLMGDDALNKFSMIAALERLEGREINPNEIENIGMVKVPQDPSFRDPLDAIRDITPPPTVLRGETTEP